jgi:DNA-binding MarR family transcriptional regulator
MYHSYVNDRRAPSPAGLFSLLHAADAAQTHVELKLSGLGLSLPKLAALSALKDAGEAMPLGQLAERLSCVKSNITQLVDRLEADGFVSRAQDPNDRRTRLAVLTAAGRKACDEGIRLRDRTERELFGALSAEEARQLAALVEKVTARTR